MGMNKSLENAQRGLLDFFFPRHCPFCGKVAGKGLLCDSCEKAAPDKKTS